MHLSLGNTTRGIIAGDVIAMCALFGGALQADNPNWKYVLGAAVIAQGSAIGALLDPGSKPTKEEAA